MDLSVVMLVEYKNLINAWNQFFQGGQSRSHHCCDNGSLTEGRAARKIPDVKVVENQRNVGFARRTISPENI
jgi:GT2 family glycosyltransferase